MLTSVMYPATIKLHLAQIIVKVGLNMMHVDACACQIPSNSHSPLVVPEFARCVPAGRDAPGTSTGTNGKDGDSNQTTCLSNVTVKMMDRYEVLPIVQNELPVYKYQHAKCL